MTFKAGASASLNKTITEIMTFLKHTHDRPNVALRSFLRDKLADFGEHWYKRGFSRGHIESRNVESRVPERLNTTVKRRLAPGRTRTVALKSKLKPRKKTRLAFPKKKSK